MLIDPSPSSRTTQLLPGWLGLEVGTGGVVVIMTFNFCPVGFLYIYFQSLICDGKGVIVFNMNIHLSKCVMF